MGGLDDKPIALRTRAGGTWKLMAGAGLCLAFLTGCGGDGGLSALFGGNSGGGGGSGSNSAPVANTPLQEPHPTTTEAARFLTQSTFGPTDATIDGLTRSTLNDWITEQQGMPQTSHLADLDARLALYRMEDPNRYIYEDDFYDSFWDQAVTGDDQLRQRVAFALSEIFVTSFTNPNVDARGMADYYDMLGRDAFGNYRTLLEDVTLHPMMGVYLNMLGNQKESPGRHPDENYAREIMQLMSLGLYKLNLDGTRALTITGDPQPSYTQNDIKGLAKVFTGWSWYDPTPDDGSFYGWSREESSVVNPMIVYPNYHSTSQKRFLGTNIPASTEPDAAGDLKIALDTLFNNPNVGPFIGKQLIQRLVTSNPSPAYVKRVATVFNNNGHGVRGDMKAVIRAVLMDSEARSNANMSQPAFGKLREPVVRLGHLLRAFKASSYTGQWRIGNTSPNWSLSQAPLDAPSVFNFWRPGYVPAQSTLGRNGYVAPEFQGANEVSVSGYINTLQYTIAYGIGEWQGDAVGNDVKLNLAADFALAEDPNAMIDHLNKVLLYGQMSSKLRAHLTTALNAIEIGTLAGGWTQNDIDNAKLDRVRTAVLLTMASPDYLAQK